MDLKGNLTIRWKENILKLISLFFLAPNTHSTFSFYKLLDS